MDENEKPPRPPELDNASPTGEPAATPREQPKSSEAQRALQEAERALRMAAAKAGIALREMGREMTAEVDAAVTDLRQAAETKSPPPTPDAAPAVEPESPAASADPSDPRPVEPELATAPGADDWIPVSGTGLEPNLAAALSYVGWAMTGILFFYVFEPRDRFVRFHALQSILLTAALMVVGVSVTAVPLIGPFLFRMAAVGFVLAWLLAIWKALRHELYPLPFIGEIARGQVDRRTG